MGGKKTTNKLIQESYNTPRYRTPQAIPLPNYERIPGLQPVGKSCSGCVPVRCVETTWDGAETL